ncbi:MAG TPA: phosphoglucosamine mutase [Gammaproteobacteria bacterium]|nr:phosphoglucosamine mutase [Gammaproteobacteria bacterium]
MINERKYFGTDGIRGTVGQPPITPDFVMKLGWAAGRILAAHGKGPVLIGKDTRISGYMFESALEAGLSAAGVDIGLLGPIPTPGIAYLTQNTRAQAGIVISASHNPYQDNGIKFFCNEGRKLPDDIELAIEREMEKPLEVVDSAQLGKARRITDAPRRYIEFCKSRISPPLDLNGLKLIIDCANGATYHIAPSVFEELGAVIETIGTTPDGLNINREIGSTYPDKLRQIVIDSGADAGIAFDGDGDRLVMVDNTGTVVDGDDVLYIIAMHNSADLRGGVVGTLMSNLALEQALQEKNLDFFRARVGDRYIMEMLLEKNLCLGGETSGHIINLAKSSTGDGIISALQVLEVMATTAHSLSDLHSGLKKYPQKMINIRITDNVDLFQLDGIPDMIKEAEDELGDHGRILIRTSGTEPLIRVMVEGEDETSVERLVNQLSSEIESVIQNRMM